MIVPNTNNNSLTQPRLHLPPDSDLENYSLTAIAVLGLVGNLGVHLPILLCCAGDTLFTFSPRPRSGEVKLAGGLTDLAYGCVAIGTIMVLLSRDLRSELLCEVGGRLMFGFLVVALLCATCWIFIASPPSGSPGKRTGWSKRSRPIVVSVFLILTWLLIPLFVFVPMSRIGYFETVSSKGFLYRCLPFHPRNSPGFEYTIFLLLVCWTSFVLGTTASLVIFVVQHSHRPTNTSVSQQLLLHGQNCVEYLLLSPGLVAMTAAVLLPSTELTGLISARWILLFLIGMTPMIHALLFLPRCLIGRLLWTRSQSELRGRFLQIPEKLTEIQNMKAVAPVSSLGVNGEAPTSSLIQSFRIAWMTKQGETKSGVVKVVPASVKSRWRDEVRTRRLVERWPHPSIERVMWMSTRNRFHAAMSCVCPDPVTINSRLLCTPFYKLGSLHDALTNRKWSLGEEAGHLVALDIAKGLSHLRQLGIIHNNLSSSSVWVRPVSESHQVILHAVIGNFEQSELVEEDEVQVQINSKSKFWHPIVHGEAGCRDLVLSVLENNIYAGDIRSYALILFELVIESLEEKRRQKTTRHRTAGTTAGTTTGCPTPIKRTRKSATTLKTDCGTRSRPKSEEGQSEGSLNHGFRNDSIYEMSSRGQATTDGGNHHYSSSNYSGGVSSTYTFIPKSPLLGSLPLDEARSPSVQMRHWIGSTSDRTTVDGRGSAEATVTGSTRTLIPSSLQQASVSNRQRPVEGDSQQRQSLVAVGSDLTGTTTSCSLMNLRPIAGLTEHHIRCCHLLLAAHPQWFEYSVLLTGDTQRIRSMLNNWKAPKNELNVLAQNMADLAEMAWISQPCLPADDLVHNLTDLLTTSYV